jgi:hypothetical protein
VRQTGEIPIHFPSAWQTTSIAAEEADRLFWQLQAK